MIVDNFNSFPELFAIMSTYEFTLILMQQGECEIPLVLAAE